MLTIEQRAEIEHALRWLQPQMAAHRILTDMLSRESTAPAEGRESAAFDSYGDTDCGYTLFGIELEEGDKRLMALLVRALGTDHPAIEDMASLLFRSRVVTTAPTKADEGREFAYPTIEHWLTEIGGEREVGHVISEMTHMEVARQAFSAARAGVATAPTMSEAARDVLAERRRQVTAEGWTPEHDDMHPCKMVVAAGCYALFADAYPNRGEPPPQWPWAPEWWKPTNFRRDLIKAGALIIAEIERIDRAAAKGESDA